MFSNAQLCTNLSPNKGLVSFNGKECPHRNNDSEKKVIGKGLFWDVASLVALQICKKEKVWKVNQWMKFSNIPEVDSQSTLECEMTGASFGAFVKGV